MTVSKPTQTDCQRVGGGKNFKKEKSMETWWIEHKEKIMDKMVSDFAARKKQFVVMSMFLGIVSLCFGVINIFAEVPVMTTPLIIFGISDIVLSVIYHYRTSLYRMVSVWLIMTIWLIGYLLLSTGGAEGIGPLWLLLAPAFTACTMGIRFSAVLCSGLWLQATLLFCTNFGSHFLRYSGYTALFRARYPVLIVVFFLMGVFLEMVREATFQKMQRLNEQLSHLSTHDSLTGAYNREGFNRKMDACMSDLKAGQEFCLLISDIDFFKRVNDTYGHDVGDQVLCITETRMEETIKPVDASICRWGGEEFAILIQNKSREESRQLAEEIRAKIQEPFQIKDGTVLNISVSIGGIHSSHRCHTLSEYVNKADEMLYYSKEHGRNQVNFVDVPIEQK